MAGSPNVPARSLRMLPRRVTKKESTLLNSNLTQPKKSANGQTAVKCKSAETHARRDMDADTNIHVVVRCRGRNARETEENDGVAVRTQGIKGEIVELSMGPSSLSNKTYNFDTVFSAAADQVTVYQEAVLPIVNEMLTGYNCTIFAYGQTGTGKTYTMSGDMTDTLGILSDNAGIIPRVLYTVFDKLKETESTVKCSFLELYNEGLRDLLSSEDNANLKILENERKNQSGSTLVHGMEETYIDSASSGIKLLRLGSEKRQVAATRCNDLSSRSHTIFTITVLTKQTNKAGESYIKTGKLNLVDLAGSENIQRSGAEDKRAAEAGLINKSLLTLGRVINALVEKTSHIPYRRESKLTRLLQDSLGGRTKTCIIATISPCCSRLEETLSTLDYAFRAKNIRNKPQINSAVSKSKLLGELAMEIEKLKSDLIATRRRNGVYLSSDAYEEMIMECESRKIINDEQISKIKMIESSLQNKNRELLTLTSRFNDLKQDNEKIHLELRQTKDVLEQTQIVLKNAKEQLEEEKTVRKAHQNTEHRLYDIGNSLLTTLDETVNDVDGLHAKLKRKSELDGENRRIWRTSTAEVSHVTEQVDLHLNDFHANHSKVLDSISTKVQELLDSDMNAVHTALSQLREFSISLDNAQAGTEAKLSGAHDEMNSVFGELRALSESVKAKINGLAALSTAITQSSREVAEAFLKFDAQLRSSYKTLGNDIKSMFERIETHLDEQGAEIGELRVQLQRSQSEATDANHRLTLTVAQLLETERTNAEAENEDLRHQIHALLDRSKQRRLSRLEKRCDALHSEVMASDEFVQRAAVQYHQHLDQWNTRNESFTQDMALSRNNIETRMETDQETLNQRNSSVQQDMQRVDQKLRHWVEGQMQDMTEQAGALDNFIAMAQSKSIRLHEEHVKGLNNLATTARNSHPAVQGHLNDFVGRVNLFHKDLNLHTDTLRESTTPLRGGIMQSLTTLQNNIQNRPLREYEPTGTTPKRRQYNYPAALPRTDKQKINSIHGTSQIYTLPTETGGPLRIIDSSSPKMYVYEDVGGIEPPLRPGSETTPPIPCLKELDLNVDHGIDDNSQKGLGSEAHSHEASPTMKRTPRKERDRRSLKRRWSLIEPEMPSCNVPSKKTTGISED
ncbi:putative Kinesin family protein [Aspergillus lentulus]|nr:putative Kinesin family protein [Aspergillus lentulus]